MGVLEEAGHWEKEVKTTQEKVNRKQLRSGERKSHLENSIANSEKTSPLHKAGTH